MNFSRNVWISKKIHTILSYTSIQKKKINLDNTFKKFVLKNAGIYQLIHKKYPPNILQILHESNLIIFTKK